VSASQRSCLIAGWVAQQGRVEAHHPSASHRPTAMPREDRRRFDATPCLMPRCEICHIEMMPLRAAATAPSPITIESAVFPATRQRQSAGHPLFRPVARRCLPPFWHLPRHLSPRLEIRRLPGMPMGSR